ncbi:MAG TPA: ABC transporter permease [Acetobacteraceae bacterium]|nr:ABC transporter permease [Acetobacteraceae bacterium]
MIEAQEAAPSTRPSPARGEGGLAAVSRSHRGRRLLKRLLLQPEISGAVMLVLIATGFAFTANNFVSLRSVSNILNILPELGLVTLGATMLIIAGEFDLSVGSLFGLTPMLMLLAMGRGVPWLPAVVAALVIAGCFGAVNGIVTLRFGIPSFITTLGMLFIARSLTIIIGTKIPLAFPDDLPVGLFAARFGLVQSSVFWLIGICTVAGVVLHRTKFGNWMYASGGQAQAARDMGIDVRAVKIACFTLCSVLAGFAGLIQCFRLQAPLASAGDGIELQAIAGAVMGGTALSGGIGSVLGAILGTVLIRVIDNGMTMSRVDANVFQLAIGLLTVVSVIVNVMIRSQAAKLRA